MMVASAMVRLTALFKPSLGGALTVRKMKLLDHILKRLRRETYMKYIKKECLVTVEASLTLCLLIGVSMLW